MRSSADGDRTSEAPLVLRWLDQLLADRRERIQQLEHLRRRLNQAFRYLDGLVLNVQRGPISRPGSVRCTRCGQPCEETRATSTSGIAYRHPEGKQCQPKRP